MFLQVGIIIGAEIKTLALPNIFRLGRIQRNQLIEAQTRNYRLSLTLTDRSNPHRQLDFLTVWLCLHAFAVVAVVVVVIAVIVAVVVVDAAGHRVAAGGEVSDNVHLKSVLEGPPAGLTSCPPGLACSDFATFLLVNSFSNEKMANY